MDTNKLILISEGTHTFEDLKNLRNSKSIWKEFDVYEDQLKELFEINNASLIDKDEYDGKLEEFLTDRLSGQEEVIKGSWVYYPWSGNLVHMVDKNEYTALRTNRNKNLITEKEQEILEDFCVGIVGLSVGHNVLRP